MPPMNVGQARVIDPILSEAARGYRHAMHVWPYIFPVVGVPARGGQVLQFGVEDFVQRNLERAPGANRQRINVGYAGHKYALTQRSLDGSVPIELLEDAQAVPNVNLGRRAATVAMQNVSLQIELEAATLALDSTKYSAAHVVTAAGAGQWDHADSTPAKAMNEYKQLVRENVGLPPNTLVVGYSAWLALQNNPDVIDRVKHVQGLSKGMEPQVSREAMKSYFDVDNFVVAEATKVTGDYDPAGAEAPVFEDIWGDNAILCYSGVSPLSSAQASMAEPSFGYCYRLNGYPVARPPWFDQDIDTWRYPVVCEDEPVIVGKDAAVLIKDLVS